MTARNFEPAKKRDLVRAAAGTLPNVVDARYDGTCTECQIGFVAGARIRRSTTGWMHAACTIRVDGTDIVNRMQARRERLRAERSAAH